MEKELIEKELNSLFERGERDPKYYAMCHVKNGWEYIKKYHNRDEAREIMQYAINNHSIYTKDYDEMPGSTLHGIELNGNIYFLRTDNTYLRDGFPSTEAVEYTFSRKDPKTNIPTGIGCSDPYVKEALKEINNQRLMEILNESTKAGLDEISKSIPLKNIQPERIPHTTRMKGYPGRGSR